MSAGRARVGLTGVLVLTMIAGVLAVLHIAETAARTTVTAYFENSNGVFVGDDVRIRGVPVGSIDAIEPQPMGAKITFWVDDEYKVPADVNAVILSPTLVTARAIQLAPPYRSGPVLQDGAVIPPERTAVPVEFDDFRGELEKLVDALKPTEPGGVSTLGEFVNTTADNLRGQGPAIRDAIIKLSQAISALGDHSDDTFASVRNLAALVSALKDSTVLIRQLNVNLAAFTGLLANDPGEVGAAIKDLDNVVEEVKSFVAENRESVGTTSDKVASVSQALYDSLDDIKQLMHIGPTTLSNAVNVYQPAQGTLSGILAANNFSDPTTFLCGAIQAASRLGAEQSAKLCVQYLAPIVKNRQYNFLPLGFNPIVGPSVRPNEVTYSEDWMRPDYVPPQPLPAAAPTAEAPVSADTPPLPAESQLSASTPVHTDPGAGLPGMMLPPSGAVR